jgi:hypothetical protein
MLTSMPLPIITGMTIYIYVTLKRIRMRKNRR